MAYTLIRPKKSIRTGLKAKRNAKIRNPTLLILLVIPFLLALSITRSYDFGIREDANYGSLVRLDYLDVGNTTSEISHNYSITNQTWSGAMVLPDERGNVISDEGRANRGTEAFTLYAHSGEDLYLIKRLSQGSPAQVVNVTLNGKYFSSWAQTPSDRTGVLFFGEAALAIPREAKSSEELSLEMAYVSGAPDVNSFGYTLYTRDEGSIPLVLKKTLLFLFIFSALVVIMRVSYSVIGSSLTIAHKFILAPKNSYHIATLVFTLICLVNYLPYASNLQNWGNVDWGPHASFVEAAREPILKYAQFPLWDPYYCGGMSLLGYPESMFLSPLFLPILVFDLLGIRVVVVIATIFGMLGFYSLSRHLNMGRFSSFLPPIVFFLNTQFQNRLQFGGFAIVFPMVFIPWIFLYLLKAEKSNRSLLLSSIFVSLALLSGSPVFLLYALIFLGILSLLNTLFSGNLRIIVIFLGILVIGLSLASVKLLPMYEFMNVYPRTTENYVEGYSVRMLEYAFLQKPDTGYIYYYHFPEQMWGWHEYTAYIGILPILLALIGFFYRFPGKAGLIITTILFLWIAMGHMAPFISLWDTLHGVPPFTSLRVPERFINLFFVGLAVLSGFGLTKVEEKQRWASFFLLAFVLIDLLIASHLLVAMSYSASPTTNLPMVGQREDSFYQYGDSIPAISAVLLNIGNANCYCAFSELAQNKVTSKVLNGKINPLYKGEAYLLHGSGNATLSSFSPNVVTINLDARANDTLIFNQNYFAGWYTKYPTDKTVLSYNGLISVNVQPSDKQITLSYLPTSFVIGLFATISSSVMVCFLYLRIGKRPGKFSNGRWLRGLMGGYRRLAEGMRSFHQMLYPRLYMQKYSVLLPALSILAIALTLFYAQGNFYDPFVGLPEKGLVLMDEIDVGLSAQEKSHNYQNYLCDTPLIGNFSYPNGTAVIDEGRLCNAGGYEIFNISTLPGHDHYLLKRLDYSNLNQGVQLLGFNMSTGKEYPLDYIWFKGNDTSNRWRDVVLKVPKKYVKTGNTYIMLKWGSGPNMNSYHYWVYADNSPSR
jgi:hypothetical protein